MVKRTGSNCLALPRLAVLVIALVGVVVLGSCPVQGQGFARAAIEGTVSDASGAAVPARW